MRIRSAQLSDLPACREVCLGTGDSGADGHHLFSLNELLSDIFVAPYFEFCLDFAWVLENEDGTACGYVLGCFNTAAFEQQLQDDWWPRMRSKYADATAHTEGDRECLDFLANPTPAPHEVASRFPSHGHIDLLPEAQGAGWGTLMMNTMMSALQAAGSNGMYLDVSVHNQRALGFYANLGFKEVTRSGESCYLGIDFD